MKLFLIIIGIVGAELGVAQSLSLYPFSSSENVIKLSKAKFDRLSITPTAYHKKEAYKTLPPLYFVTADTLRKQNPVAVVLGPIKNKQHHMLAYLKKDSVQLLDIGEHIAGKGIQRVKQFADLTGDGFNEVFIYYSYYHSWDDEMTSGHENLNYLEVWDPEKKQRLLYLLLNSKGQSWSMCNGGSSHTSHLELYFYAGGFSVMSSNNIHSRDENSYSDKEMNDDYRYTPTGFVKDTLGNCLLHVNNSYDLQALRKEYQRLKSNNINCPSAPGLYRCMRLMAITLPRDADSLQVTALLGPPDKIQNQLPPEFVNSAFRHSWQDNSQLWLYTIHPDIYFFIIMRENKNKLFYWYASQQGLPLGY